MNKEELNKFCSEDETRFNIHEPFSIDDFTYATDGYVIIRVPRIKEIAENQGAPDPVSLFNDFDDIGPTIEFYEIPELPERKFHECVFCKGTGKVIKKGVYYECEKCDGTKQIEEVIKIKIGSALFNRNFLEKLKPLPKVEIGPTAEDKAALIKFTDGTGLIMPIRW